MQVYLDEELIPIDRPTLSAAIGAAARRAQTKGRVIVSAEADGSPLSDDTLASPSDSATTILELKLRSAEPRRIVAEMLRHAADAAEAVRTPQADAARLVQAGRPEEAGEHLQAVFTIWQAITEGLHSGAAMLGLDLTTTRIADTTPGALIDDLLVALRGVQASLATQDWSAVGDALAYDLDEISHRWKAMLTGLAATLESTPSAPGAPGRR